MIRYVGAAWHDWTARYRAAVPASVDAEALVWRVLDGSVIGRFVDAVSAAFGRAYAESRLAVMWGAVQALAPLDRFRAVGVICVAAPVVHVGLMSGRAPGGMWWIILPAIVLAFGLLVLGLSVAASRR